MVQYESERDCGSIIRGLWKQALAREEAVVASDRKAADSNLARINQRRVERICA